MKHTQNEVADILGISRGQVCHACDRVRNKVGREERKPRIYKEEDVFTIASRSTGHSVKITEKDLRLLKKLYCLERLTINQLCREMRMPRRDFHLVKTAFGITKDDTPFLDEDLINISADDLAVDSLQEKKRLYFIKLQQKEIEQLRKENNEYRKQEFMLDQIQGVVAEHMTAFARKYQGPVIPHKKIKGNFMLEVPVYDLHVGKLGWEPEVGESYDYKIARQRYENTVNDIYTRAETRPIEKILMVIGSDYFHYDTIEVATTAGTQQDTDTRWQQLYGVGYEMLVKAIDKFALLAPVEVIHIPGNHDTMASWHAMMYIHAWYKDIPRVTVVTNPKSRKYVEYGVNLIGFTHGDKEKKRLFGNMQVEAPEAWGRSRFREWHCGHLHSEQTKEDYGVKVRKLSSLAGPDSWHFNHGYVGAIPTQQSFLWHKETGLYEIWQSNI